MDAFIKWMDSRSRIVKILFCLPFVDIIWAVYRIILAIKKNDILWLVLGIIWIIVGGFIGWVLDLVCIILFNHIFWFQD